MEKGDSMVAKKRQVQLAINFLFPGLGPNSSRFKEIAKFIRSEFNRLGTCVLWYRNERFMKLLRKLRLSIDKEEVIITPCAVLATNDCACRPTHIFKA